MSRLSQSDRDELREYLDGVYEFEDLARLARRRIPDLLDDLNDKDRTIGTLMDAMRGIALGGEYRIVSPAQYARDILAEVGPVDEIEREPDPGSDFEVKEDDEDE